MAQHRYGGGGVNPEDAAAIAVALLFALLALDHEILTVARWVLAVCAAFNLFLGLT